MRVHSDDGVSELNLWELCSRYIPSLSYQVQVVLALVIYRLSDSDTHFIIMSVNGALEGAKCSALLAFPP